MACNINPSRAGMLGVLLIAHTARPGMSVAAPLPGIGLRRRISAFLTGIRAATRSTSRQTREKEPFYPPPRTAFVEEAAMAREMYRL